MKSFKKSSLVGLAILVLVLTGCSMKKRVCQPGYYKEWLSLKTKHIKKITLSERRSIASVNPPLKAVKTDKILTAEKNPSIVSADNSIPETILLTKTENYSILHNGNELTLWANRTVEQSYIRSTFKKDELNEFKTKDLYSTLKKVNVKKTKDNIFRCILLGIVFGVFGFFALFLGIAVGAAVELGAGIIILLLIACVVGGIWGAVESCQ